MSFSLGGGIELLKTWINHLQVMKFLGPKIAVFEVSAPAGSKYKPVD